MRAGMKRFEETQVKNFFPLLFILFSKPLPYNHQAGMDSSQPVGDGGMFRFAYAFVHRNCRLDR